MTYKNNKIISNFTDMYTKLLNERIIFLSGEINDNLSNSIVTQLLLLESYSENKKISMYINSPGGSITSGIAIYDTIQFIKPKVRTFCIGTAASMAAVLLASGSKKNRYSLPNSRIMIHQPLGMFKGQATDIEIQTKEIMYLKKKINKIFSKHTGKDEKKICRDTERDNFMSPKEAKKYGIIDEILK
ncbi:ATP-dependent Clp protease proteolytic subunit [Candidatus Vidania fulgoroideae]|uniref:ATP-dependent Clp protease proteolytic subunit n=1 Tax=Candidatus Vidania fulgoroideorum TaxID=881286 RepID=A0AAX3NBC6_9PROT|nr:ATP-dependent Clp protease proteolytic subunit [Candidatus Vidania fulgoroideae]WDR79365.1 ATP-dependent Clp protease proteolytic subunit [Candidatus Vidania fulgoroideae]